MIRKKVNLTSSRSNVIMKHSIRIFRLAYLMTIIGVVILSVNLFFDIVDLPTYMLPLLLVVGASMFFLEAMIQRKTRNKNV